MALAALAWGPECSSQYPCEKLGMALYVFITPVLGGGLGQEDRKIAQAHWLENTAGFEFSERPHLREIR